MKSIYTKENVQETVKYLQKRYSNLHNKKYSLDQIIYAFNKLPGKYQDLLLKNNKDENDKANLSHIYDHFKKTLLITKDVPDNIEVLLKNIDEEEKKQKEQVSIEDIEVDNNVVENNNNRKKQNNKIDSEILNRRIKEVILEEYNYDRKEIDVENLLEEIDMDDDNKYIILLKYENNMVKTNADLSTELGIKEEYIDEVVDGFLDIAINHKKKKLLSLERK